MVSLHCINLELLMTEMGHLRKSPFSALCQLPPAADITTQMPTPLGATSNCKLSQQICPLLDQLVGGGR